MNLRRLRIPRRLLQAIAATVLIATAARVAGIRADRALRIELLQQARVAAMAITSPHAWELQGTPEDLPKREYIRIKNRLAAIRMANPQYRFLYLMTPRPDGAIVFLVDSEPESSPDFSPPGQEYAQATPELRASFVSGDDLVEGPAKDQWGVWVSALVHLPRPESGARPILLGVDVNARHWARQVALHAALPAFLAALVVLLAMGSLLLLQNHRRLQLHQDELIRSEKRFNELATHNRTITWEIDAQGRFTFASPGVESVLGIAPESLVGAKHFFDMHPADKHEAFRQDLFARISRREVFQDVEHPVPLPGGSIRWLSSSGMPRLNPDGTLRGYRGSSVDVTERRLAREALQTSEAQKQAILDNIPLHVLLLDKELRVQWANRAAAESVGKRAEDTVGTPCHAFWGDPAAPCDNCPAVAALRSGEPGHARVTTPDGRTWDERAAPVFDADGRIAGVVEISEDITEHNATETQVRELLDESTRARQALLGILEDEKATEEQLKRQTQAQQLLIHISSSFINRPLDTLDEALQDALEQLGQFTGADRAYVFDYDFERRICRNTHEWCREGIQPQMDQLQTVPLASMSDWIEAHGAGKPVHVADIRDLPPGPARESLEAQSIQSLYTTPLMEGRHCAGFIGFDAVRAPHPFARPETTLLGVFAELLVNVRLRRRSEDQQHRLETQLMRSQKMDSIGRLAGGVAHDFNNHLTVILGHVGILLEASALDPTRRSRLEEIRRAASDSAALTRQLLAFGRKQTIAPKTIDLNETVAGAVQMLQRLIGENIDLRWLPADGLWPVTADPSQIHQILTNLCINARDAIEGSGRIDIETANETLPTPPENHPDMVAGDYVRLSVRDSGMGMTPAILENLFEPFFSTKGGADNTGLGLPMVYGIVRQNKGFIDVSSAPGQGSAFHIHLPQVGRAAASPPPPPPAPAARPGHTTVLLVEDEPAILAMTAEILDSLGYSVRSALSPVEAIRLAREHAGTIELLLSDVVMPGMNGRDLAQTLRALHPGLRVLYMSGYTDDIMARSGIDDDDVEFLAKPFSKEELAAKVRQALADT